MNMTYEWVAMVKAINCKVFSFLSIVTSVYLYHHQTNQIYQNMFVV